MYKGNTVSLVFPAFNEEQNIVSAITSFAATGIIDEIIVVDNNSTDATATLARQQKANVVREKRQGYGYALRKGLASASGDYIVLAEPDGTFKPTDLKRLLLHLKHFDAVLGSRTNRKYIATGAHMGFLLRVGNVLLAKVLQLLFATTSLSDCGCTYRAIRKQALSKIIKKLKVGGSHFLPEMVIQLAQHKYQLVEVPVHYYPRVGTSKITGSLLKAITVGWHMFALMLKHFFISKPQNTKK